MPAHDDMRAAESRRFETFFHTLTEPMTLDTTSYTVGNYWDRSGNTGFGSRRAFYSKFLIVSGGPDQTVGIFRYPDTSPPTAIQLIANENNAMPFSTTDVIDFATASSPQIPTGTTIAGPSGTNPLIRAASTFSRRPRTTSATRT